MHLMGCQNPKSGGPGRGGGGGGGKTHVSVELSVFIEYQRQMVCLAA